MVTLSKPILCNLSIRLPESLKMRLRCGTLTVNDLMDMMIDTLNNFLGKADRNAGAMEEFAGALTEWADGVQVDLTNWKDMTERELLEAIAGKEVPIRFVINNGDIVWDFLSDEVKEMIQAGGGGAAAIKSVYVTKQGDVIVEVDDDESHNIVMAGGVQWASSFYENDVVNDLIVAPSDGIPYDRKGGLMTTQDWIDLQKLKNKMPYVDADGFLVIGGNKYVLTKAEEQYVETKYYDDIEIISIAYNANVTSNGKGTAPDSITYNVKEYTLRNGQPYGNPVMRTETIKTGNKASNVLGAKVFYSIYDNPSGVTMTADGVVNAPATTKGYEAKLGYITADVVIGEAHAVCKSKPEIYQDAAHVVLSKYKLTSTKNAGTLTVDVDKSDGVMLSFETEAGFADAFAASYNDSTKKITIAVKANNTTQKRTAKITMKTNIEMEDGEMETQTITVEQAAGTQTVNAVYGSSLGVPTTIAGGQQRSIDSDVTVLVASTFDQKVNVHWVAIPNSSTKRVSKFEYGNGTEIDASHTHVDENAIAGYKLYYFIDNNSYIQNSTKFYITN